MKLNVTVDLDWICGEEGEIYLEQSIKKEITQSLVVEVAKRLKDDLIKETSKQEFFEQTKKEFEQEIKELKEIPRNLSKEVRDNIDLVFKDILKTKTFKVNGWGKVEEETTIEKLVEGKLEQFHKSYNDAIKDILSSEIKKISLSDSAIKDFVKAECNKVGLENARKITEFFVNGLK